MESPAHSSHYGNGNGNGNGNGKKVAAQQSYRTRPSNGKPLHKASAVATAWDDSTGGSETLASNGSSGISTPSMDAEFGDAESHKSLSSLSPDPSQLPLKVHVMETLISSIFSTVSSIKNAYMQLQSAHAPYDADKLQLADKAVIAELKKLSELKHSYRERLAIISLGHVQEEDSEAQPQVESKEKISYEGIISDFHSEIQMKDAAMEGLKDMLAQTTLKKEKLDRRVKRLEQRLARESLVNFPNNDASPTPQLLESAVLGASEASRTFTKLLISLMKTAQWDLDAAANSIEPNISYVRRTHKKFAFESYVSHRMLNGFESANFHISGDSLTSGPSPDHSRQQCFKEFQELRRILNPAEAVFAKPESMFAKYCLKKFLDLIHPKMEESFFGNLEHRKQVSSGTHPSSQFYQSFLKLARAMWVLHNLAYSLEPNARIFQVKRGTDFSPLYMESIVQMVEIDLTAPGVRPKVGFTVMPGFRVLNTIIKCQVYITATRLDEPVEV